jgi:hypothetical protein
MEQKSLQSVHYYRSYIEFCLCYAYVVNPVSLTPMVYSRLRDLRSVRYPSLVAYPCSRQRSCRMCATVAAPSERQKKTITKAGCLAGRNSGAGPALDNEAF